MAEKRCKTIFLVVLCIILFVAFAVFLILSIILLIEKNNTGDKGKTSLTCSTPNCVQTAASIIQSANLRVDPCTDFYEFACGTWMENTRIPDDKAAEQVLFQPATKLDYDLRAILETPAADNSPLFEKNVKNFYASCMNTDEIESEGTMPMINLLSQYGGWPILTQTWNESAYNLTRLLSQLKFVGPTFISVDQLPNVTDTRRLAIGVSQGDLTIERSYYLESQYKDKMEFLKKYIYNVSDAFGMVRNRSLFEKDVNDIIAFETKLAAIYVPAGDLSEQSTYKTMTIKDVSSMFGSEFDFKSYIISIYKEANVSLTEKDVVYLVGSAFFETIPQLLRETPKRVILNYLCWRIVDNYIITMPQKFLNLNQQKTKVLAGVLQEAPRWKTCVGIANSIYGLPISNLYVKQYFSENTKAAVQEMVSDVQQALLAVIDQVPWMSNWTKVVAKDKANYIKQYIGYPDYVLNSATLNSLFKNQPMLTATDYLKNLLQWKFFGNSDYLATIKQPTDKSLWPIVPTVINAVYDPSANTITFPAAFLQKPVYDPNNPKYITYGGLGSIIGHEFTHGFDTMGSQYDKNGNLNNWWPEVDRTAFNEQTKCMIDQYNRYIVPEINQQLNGAQTIGENIADNGGLKEAYLGYKNWMKRNGDEQSLPGLPYNSNQLFFIGFAQNWCELRKPAYATEMLLTDVHSPGRFRVIGALSNSKEFSQAFNCPVNSPMNPVKKCSVW